MAQHLRHLGGSSMLLTEMHTNVCILISLVYIYQIYQIYHLDMHCIYILLVILIYFDSVAHI